MPRTALLRVGLIVALAAAIPAVLLATEGGPSQTVFTTASPAQAEVEADPVAAEAVALPPEPVTPPTELAAASDAPTSTAPAAPPAVEMTTPASAPPPPADGLAPVVSRVDTADPVVFITIDDGLERDPAVLDWLRANPVPVSLFLLQRLGAEGEAYFREMQELGATIHPHSYTHADLTTVSDEQRREEICGPLDDFEARFGFRPTLFRPPYGATNEAVRRVAAECGFHAVALWKAAMNNGQLQLQEEALKPGDIVLLHFRPELVQELQVLVDTATAAGLRIGRLEDYL